MIVGQSFEHFAISCFASSHFANRLPGQSTVSISYRFDDSDHIAISRFVSSCNFAFDFFKSGVNEMLISHHVSSLTMDDLDDFGTINGCDLFASSHFVNPHNSAL
jgi:hypothetical protein